MQCARSSVPTASAHRERMLEKAEEDRQRLPLPVRPPPAGTAAEHRRRKWARRLRERWGIHFGIAPEATPRWRPKRSTTRRVFVDEWIVFFRWWPLDFQYAMI